MGSNDLLKRLWLMKTSCFFIHGNSFFILNRKCEQNQVFFKTGDPHPYCKNACEAHTMCGEVEVPEEHLEVCRVCNAFGQNCQSHESSKPAGPGKTF